MSRHSDLLIVKSYRNKLRPTTLVDAARPLPIADLPLLSMGWPPRAECGAWLLSIDCRWFRCDVTLLSRGLLVERPMEGVVGGMSGSPIVSDEGKVIGVLCKGTSQGGGPNPFLARNLPVWLLDEAGLGAGG
jgi:hypothetical protein